MSNRFLIFTPLVVAILLFSSSEAALSARFEDLKDNSAERSINRLSDKAVIPAAADGKFNPDNALTRAELAAWLGKVLQLDDKDSPTDVKFTDVKDDDAKSKSIKLTAKYFDTEGDTFKPDQTLTRAKLICVLAKSLSEDDVDEHTMNNLLAGFPDGFTAPDWCKAALSLLCKDDVFRAAENDSVRANDAAKRAEAAILLDRLDHYRNQKLIAQAIENADKKEAAAKVDPNVDVKVAAVVDPGVGDPEVVDESKNVPVDIIPRGAHFEVILDEGLDTTKNKNKRGDKRIGTTRIAANNAGTTRVIEAGAVFKGQLTSVMSAKRFFGSPGRVMMRFYEIEMPDGLRCPVAAKVDTSKTKLVGGLPGDRAKHVAHNALKGAGIGFLIGSIVAPAVSAYVPGGYGALAGMGTRLGSAAIGGIVGAGVTKGVELKWEKEQAIEIVLDRLLRLPTSNPAPIEQAEFQE